MVRNLTVALPELPRLMARLGTRSQAAISRGVQSAGMRALTVMERAVREAPPANSSGKGVGGAFNTGHYLRSWKATPQRTATGIGLLIYTAGVPYAGVIEYGRRIGARMPPVEPIARWAQRRLGLPYPEAKKAAFAIRRTIKRRGLKGRHVLTSERTENKLISVFKEEVLRELVLAMGTP